MVKIRRLISKTYMIPLFRLFLILIIFEAENRKIALALFFWLKIASQYKIMPKIANRYTSSSPIYTDFFRFSGKYRFLLFNAISKGISVEQKI